jgi:hypothetical protein
MAAFIWRRAASSLVSWSLAKLLYLPVFDQLPTDPPHLGRTICLLGLEIMRHERLSRLFTESDIVCVFSTPHIAYLTST